MADKFDSTNSKDNSGEAKKRNAFIESVLDTLEADANENGEGLTPKGKSTEPDTVGVENSRGSNSFSASEASEPTQVFSQYSIDEIIKDFSSDTENEGGKKTAFDSDFAQEADETRVFSGDDPFNLNKDEQTENEADKTADILTGDSSAEATVVISDEKLAELLDMSPEELSESLNKAASENVQAEEAQNNSDSVNNPDGTIVFPGLESADDQAADEGQEALEENTEETENEEDEYEARDFRPFRRRRNYRVGLMGGLMYFTAVVCISVILASMCWLAANDVLSLNKKEVTAEITVPENFTIETVARDLKAAGIIDYTALFKLFSKFSHADTKIDPGTYELSSNYDYRAIVTNLQQGSEALKTVKVTIPEGKTMRQTFRILEENDVCTYEELMECAKNYEFDFDFLSPEKLGTDNRLEGFLFPDTYEFYVNSSPEGAIKKFLNNFEKKVTEDMYVQAAQLGYTFDEILTIASMVEMEAAKDSERPKIASVIYNRLNSSEFRYLQIDATIQYALEERKDKLTYDDLEIDSPYNTYRCEGLPPGPIANPGIASIQSALTPEVTSYYYYALNKNGSHDFFTNSSAFESFVNSSSFGG